MFVARPEAAAALALRMGQHRARERGFHPMSAAVAWVAAHPAVTAPIIGARNTDQRIGSKSSSKRLSEPGPGCIADFVPHLVVGSAARLQDVEGMIRAFQPVHLPAGMLAYDALHQLAPA